MAKILVVDDNIDMLDTLEHLLSFYDFDVVRAENGKVALSVAELEQPELILLDALMPVMNGFEACGHLKSNAKTCAIPVIFLSANYTEDKHRNRGLELGADDYILKPFNAKDLIAKVNELLKKKQLMDKIRQDNGKMLQKSDHISQELEELKKRTAEFESSQDLDQLTGLYNSEIFQQRLDEVFRRAFNENELFSLALIDVDFFQRINETFGEQAGDYLLIRIANVILSNTESSEIVFRLERNKFGVMLPNKNETAAFYEAERLRTAIHQTHFFEKEMFELKKLSPKQKLESQSVTVSIGISELTGDISKGLLVKRVEDALIQAKAKGRNTTVRFSELN